MGAPFLLFIHYNKKSPAQGEWVSEVLSSMKKAVIGNLIQTRSLLPHDLCNIIIFHTFQYCCMVLVVFLQQAPP